MNLLILLLVCSLCKEYGHYSEFNYDFTFLSESAIMTLLKANNPELIDTLSLNLSPVTPDLFNLSEPARSIKFILKDNLAFDILSILSIKIVKIA